MNYLKIILAILLVIPLIASAGVNPKNGNFYITYTDIDLEANSQSLNITRTYNSKSTFVGWFGFGWSGPYETRLVVMPDGSAVIDSGRAMYYRVANEAAIKSGVQKIVDVVTKRDNLDAATASALSRKLLSDEEERFSAVVKYGIKSDLPLGAALDDICGKATLARTKTGYRRVDCNRFGDSEPAIDTFDFQGRLTRHELENGYAVVLRYRDNGAVELSDNRGQNIALVFSPEGRVLSAQSNKEKVTYSYDKNNDLIEAATSNGLTYGYSYDNNHNLTRINYIDGSNMFISYSPRFNGMADSVITRQGDRETYLYHNDPDDSRHYWTQVTSIPADGEPTTKVYEFEDELSPTGVIQNSRIAQNGQSLERTLDTRGRVVRQATGGGRFIELTYDSQSDKVSMAVNGDVKTYFAYDQNGNLIRASSSEGRIIYLYYGSTPKIESLVEIDRKTNTRRELIMKYDSGGNPEEILLVGKGKIFVKYDAEGKIMSTYSEHGAEMAMEVARVFNSLVKIIEVAGAEL